MTQLVEPAWLGGGTESYLYDAFGQRVEKSVSGGATTLYLRDVFGNVAAEYSNGTGTPPCTTCYLDYDHLGMS